MPLYRHVATRVHPLLFSLTAGKWVSESTNGFRAFRTTLLDDPRIRLGAELARRVRARALPLLEDDPPRLPDRGGAGHQDLPAQGDRLHEDEADHRLVVDAAAARAPRAEAAQLMAPAPARRFTASPSSRAGPSARRRGLGLCARDEGGARSAPRCNLGEGVFVESGRRHRRRRDGEERRRALRRRDRRRRGVPRAARRLHQRSPPALGALQAPALEARPHPHRPRRHRRRQRDRGLRPRRRRLRDGRRRRRRHEGRRPLRAGGGRSRARGSVSSAPAARRSRDVSAAPAASLPSRGRRARAHRDAGRRPA